MISENKIKHSLGVARYCENLAAEKGLSKDEQLACFVMRLLHDIGYERATEITEHPKESAIYIEAFLKHADECLIAIAGHGKPANYNIYEYILNSADMHVDYQGREVGIQKRLKDIKTRHGEDSLHYKHALQVAENILKSNL